MRRTRLSYDQKRDELREIIARTIAPNKISLLLEELAKTDWEAFMLSLQIEWRECPTCGCSFRLTRLDRRTSFCSQCFTGTLKREANKVTQQLARAYNADAPATLTVDEWLDTLNHFEWKCAYCNASYSEMEHFIPITQQGGTTKDNCIPTCHRCNMLKDNLHPDEVTRIPRDAIERVANYLNQFKKPERAPSPV